MTTNWQRKVRTLHRYLGLFIGIQFILWTVGGLYFSWSNIDEVHGDPEKHSPSLLSASLPLVAPQVVLDSLQKTQKAEYLVALQLINLYDKPVYQIMYQTNGKQKIQLADALTGKLRPALNEREAVILAKSRFQGNENVTKVEYLTSTDRHHEYRENPLPAFAISFDNSNKTTVYVASELGTVQKFRNKPWRIFDFLWMLHTMDYESRDNIGNLLLKGFSVLGLLTISSGFILFAMTSKTLRKINKPIP